MRSLFGFRCLTRQVLFTIGTVTVIGVLMLSLPVLTVAAPSTTAPGDNPAQELSQQSNTQSNVSLVANRTRTQMNVSPVANEIVPFFGVYPGGGTGETPGIPNPDARVVDQRLKELASGRPLAVHLYTAWSWHNDSDLDAQIARYTGAGLKVTLTIKYSPPQGHVGDIAGYESFVRSVVKRYANNRSVVSYVVGNEANVAGNPDASDGPFAGARTAVVRGTIAARSELASLGSPARVGVNFAVGSAKENSEYLRDLVAQGGDEFLSAVQFIGINVYPGIWQAGTGDSYRDMVGALELGRASIDAVAGLAGRPLEVREAGAPLIDEAEKARRVQAFTQAVVDQRTRLNIGHFSWFDLWDADSSSTYQFAHYGLLRSDLSHTASFQAYKDLIARTVDIKA